MPIRETLSFGLVGQPIEVLTRLRSGAIWIFIGMGARFVSGTIGGLLGVGAVAAMEFSVAFGVGVALLGFLVLVGAEVVSLIGHWRYSTPLTGVRPDGWKYGGYRRTLRITSVILVVVAIANSPLPMLALASAGATTTSAFGATSSPGMRAVDIAFMITYFGAALLSGLAQIIRYIATAAYTSALATRLPDQKLARRAKFVYQGTALAIIAVIVLVAVFAGASALAGTTGTAVGVGMIVSGIGLVLTAILSLALWVAWIVMLAQFLAGISKVRKRAMLGQTA